MSYEKEVVQSQGVCCANTRTLDHFCGNGSLIKGNMRSRCNSCGAEVHAEAWKSNDNPPRVYMRKYCPTHGVTSSRISSDARFYYNVSDGKACGCEPGGCKPSTIGENASTASTLHTCTLVVEIVRDCNLACPTCYADSPQREAGAHGTNLSIDDLASQVNNVIAKQGKIDILQLSGGEPTLHPKIFELISWATAHEGISQILLNTNGVRLAEESFVAKLATVVPKGKFGIYLQYDGADEPGQFLLRGGDFRKIREKALMNCRKYSLPVALVMTVTHDNKFSCATAINYALQDDNIPWIVFQPEFLSGRNDKSKLLEVPINVADVVHSVAQGSLMALDSWIPLPCSDPNCGTVGFLVRMGGVWCSASKLIDLSSLTHLIANRMNFDVDFNVNTCGCDNYELADYLTQYGVKREDIKMVFVKPFMDTRTWDSARIASCCTHVLTPTGEVDSFCRFYGLKT